MVWFVPSLLGILGDVLAEHLSIPTSQILMHRKWAWRNSFLFPFPFYLFLCQHKLRMILVLIPDEISWGLRFSRYFHGRDYKKNNDFYLKYNGFVWGEIHSSSQAVEIQLCNNLRIIFHSVGRWSTVEKTDSNISLEKAYWRQDEENRWI